MILKMEKHGITLQLSKQKKGCGLSLTFFPSFYLIEIGLLFRPIQILWYFEITYSKNTLKYLKIVQINNPKHKDQYNSLISFIEYLLNDYLHTQENVSCYHNDEDELLDDVINGRKKKMYL